MSIDTASLLADEARYCSHGDTVHYVNPPKIFTGCDGSYMIDDAGTRYLDLQMWHSAVNFGYRNQRLEDALRRQLDVLPQVASQYLHPSKIELARFIAQDAERKWGHAGRVHFNVGGAQAAFRHFCQRRVQRVMGDEASRRAGDSKYCHVTVHVKRNQNATLAQLAGTDSVSFARAEAILQALSFEVFHHANEQSRIWQQQRMGYFSRISEARLYILRRTDSPLGLFQG